MSGARIVALNSHRAARCAAAAALIALAFQASAAHASILFTPHLDEYADLPRGSYADHTLVFTHITKVFDDEGTTIPLGAPFVGPGQRLDAALLLFRYLWIGNLFENTWVPFLNDHKQIFRVIANAGWQETSEAITERSRLFGLHTGGNGVGDLFVLGGLYSHEHRLGPLKFNGLLATTVKIPVGSYDTGALLNVGSHYWSTMPQLAAHADLFGRLHFDGTVAYQFNGRNDAPAYGGMTPTEPANVYNLEGNLAWQFNEKWFWDVGAFFRKSRGPNKFGNVTATFVDPQPATTLCADPTGGLIPGLSIPPNLCSVTNHFALIPVAGEREDKGIRQLYLSTSVYYIYRTSSVIDFRVAYPLNGRGSQFPMDYDVALIGPDGSRTPISDCSNPQDSACQHTKLNGVQEAAAVPAAPLFELRFVYLFWAP